MCWYLYSIPVYLLILMFPFVQCSSDFRVISYNNCISLRTVPTCREGFLQTVWYCVTLPLGQNTWSGYPVLFSLWEWACVGVWKWHKAVRQSSSTSFCAGKRRWTLREKQGWRKIMAGFLGNGFLFQSLLGSGYPWDQCITQYPLNNFFLPFLKATSTIFC